MNKSSLRRSTGDLSDSHSSSSSGFLFLEKQNENVYILCDKDGSVRIWQDRSQLVLFWYPMRLDNIGPDLI